MQRTCRVALSLWLILGSSGCGGSKTGDAGGSPTAPGTGGTPAPVPVPPPPPGLAHGYFASLSGRSDVLAAYSLRDQAMLDVYARGTGGAGSIDVTYDFARDPDPRRQDAAKVTIPADKVSVPTHVRLPIPAVGTDSLFVTWDAWWGKEFAYANTQIGNYKAFQFASPDTQIWTEIKSDFDLAEGFPPAVAMVTARTYGEPGETVGPNVTDRNPLSPQAAAFPVAPETWTRYWVQFKPAGQWFEFSLWVADETRGPVLVLDRLLLKPNVQRGAAGWESFWLEYNTSANRIPPARGPLVGYVRNVVMLKGVTDPTPLLQMPGR